MQYEIFGEPFAAVQCKLSNGEAMRTEGGSMIWMSPNMKMETSGGGAGKVFGRLFTGESLFQNIYTAQGDGMIAFGSSFPGQILPMQITPGNSLIVQKCGFLCSEMGVDLSVHINERIGGGFFGGEGFVMQKLSGNGMAFIECDGSLRQFELAAGQQIIVDTGNVLAVTEGVQISIQRIKGAKNILLGGEGLFNTVLTGPGKVWLQTMPISSVAMEIAARIPSSGN